MQSSLWWEYCNREWPVKKEAIQQLCGQLSCKMHKTFSLYSSRAQPFDPESVWMQSPYITMRPVGFPFRWSTNNEDRIPMSPMRGLPSTYMV